MEENSASVSQPVNISTEAETVGDQVVAPETSASHEVPKKGNKAVWALGFITVVVLLAVACLFYQNNQLRRELEMVKLSNEPTELITEGNVTPTPDPTAGWNKHDYGWFEIMLPLDLEEYAITETTVDFATTPPMTEPYITITKVITDFESLELCNNNELVAPCAYTKSPDNVLLGDSMAIKFEMQGNNDRKEVVIQTPNYEIRVLNNPGYESGMLDQILSTFKFVDSDTDPTLTSKPLSRILVGSVSNWQTIVHDGIEFKIPENATFNYKSDPGLVSWTGNHQGNTINNNIKIYVLDYTGGSRRQQFYDRFSEDPKTCNHIYQEAIFGSIKALQIANDGSWCQGGGGGTVAIIGNKLVILYGLNYVPTGEITRSSTYDTLLSTLKQSN